MPVIRINKEQYELLKARAKAEDRPLSRVIARILTEALKEKPKGNPSLKEKKVHPLFADLKNIYIEAWQKNNGFAYRWNGAVDATALNRLIKTLEGINKSESTIVDLFNVIMDKLPAFYYDKSINAINKNINGIIAEIKSGGNKGSNLHQDGGIYDFRK